MSLIPDYGDPADPNVRAKYGKLESSISLVCNIGLFIAKLMLGIAVLSIAIIGDSLNHLMDMTVSVVMIYSFHLMTKAPDEEHPYGHGRAEPIMAIVVSALIITMGILVINEAVENLDNPLVDANYLSVMLLFVFSAVKFSLGGFAFSIVKRAPSEAIRADAWNHTSDGLISVVVAVGILITILAPDLKILDPALAVGIGVFVILTGVNLVRTSAQTLMGRAPDEKTVGDIRKLAESVSGVKDVHNIHVHDYGEVKSISFHVSVHETLTAVDAHEIALKLEEAIEKAYKSKPIVHIDPIHKHCEKCVLNQIKEVAASYPEVVSVHQVEVNHTADGAVVDMHAVIDKATSIEDGHKLVHNIMVEVEKRYPGHKLKIHLEPCHGNCEECDQSCEGAD